MSGTLCARRLLALWVLFAVALVAQGQQAGSSTMQAGSTGPARYAEQTPPATSPLAGAHRGDQVHVTLARPADKAASGTLLAFDAQSFTLERRAVFFGRYTTQRYLYSDVASGSFQSPVHKPIGKHDRYVVPLVILGVVVIAAFVTLVVVLAHSKSALAV